jgi:hypothetical protein
VSRKALNVSLSIDAPPEKVRMKAGHALRPEGSGTRVELSMEISGFMAPLISRLYGGLIREYVTTESQKLKVRSETAAG